MEPVSVGIDVSKAELVIAVQPSGEHFTSATTGAALDALVARLKELAPQIIIVEATGGRTAAGRPRGERGFVRGGRESASGPGVCAGARAHGEDG